MHEACTVLILARWPMSLAYRLLPSFPLARVLRTRKESFSAPRTQSSHRFSLSSLERVTIQPCTLYVRGTTYLLFVLPGPFDSGDGLLVERWTRYRKVASSSPGRNEGIILFSRVRCPFHPLVTAVACKRPRSFCHNCRWQIPLKHTYTLDSMKSQWAHCAVQA